MRSLINWRPRAASPLDLVRNEMNNVLGRFFVEPWESNGGTPEAWTPRVDVEETDKEILVKAELAGVDPKDMAIEVLDGFE